jgi:hypothetical protein
LPPAPIPLVPPKIRGMVGKRLPRFARRRR